MNIVDHAIHRIVNAVSEENFTPEVVDSIKTLRIALGSEIRHEDLRLQEFKNARLQPGTAVSPEQNEAGNDQDTVRTPPPESDQI